MRTKDTSQGKYAIIQDPDLSILYEMAENCRGIQKRNHFEKDSGIPIGFYTKIKHNKKTGPYKVSDIEKIVSHKDEQSNITLDAMLAANGMMPFEPLQKMHFILQPVKKDVQDLRRKEYALPQYVHCDYYPDDKNRFLDDISFFAVHLSQKDAGKIKDHLDKIFSDKAIVRMLYKFRKHKNQELINMKKQLSGKENTETEDSDLADYYKEVILELIDEL